MRAAGQGFQVCRQPLLHPVVAVGEVGEAEVEHLVGYHPVVVEVGLAGGRADVDSDEATAVGDAPAHAAAAVADLDRHALHGEAAEVARCRGGGRLDPLEDLLARRAVPAGEADVDDAAADAERGVGEIRRPRRGRAPAGPTCEAAEVWGDLPP